MTTRNPEIFQSDEGLVISGAPDDLKRLAEALMLAGKHAKSVHATLTDDLENKLVIKTKAPAEFVNITCLCEPISFVQGSTNLR